MLHQIDRCLRIILFLSSWKAFSFRHVTSSSYIYIEAAEHLSLSNVSQKGWPFDGLASRNHHSMSALNHLNRVAFGIRGGGDGVINTTPSKKSQESDILNQIKDDINQIKDDIQDVWDDLVEDFSDSAFAGKIFPIISKLVIRRQTARHIFTSLKSTVKFGDLVFILIVGWATIPVLQFFYDRHVYSVPVIAQSQNITAGIDVPSTEQKESTGKIIPTQESTTPAFNKTFLYQFADHISQAGKIAGLVYVIDCLNIIVKCMGFDVKNYSQVIAKIIYTVWTFRRFQLLKTYLVNSFFRVSKVRKGSDDRMKRGEQTVEVAKAKIVDQLTNILMYLALTFSIVDLLQVEAGLALKSFLTFGSAGTLVFSLASQDLAKQLVSGLALTTSTNFYEGEQVMFGTDLKGVVERMGYLKTRIRNQDESVLSIPNTMLVNQKFSNLSRTKRSQVKQTLNFNYDDADRLPQILHDIKREIITACPTVITDGSRPFRVVWTDYEDDHLKVMVDVHFDIKPVGDAYHNNRQRCLMAIHRAIKSNGVELYTSSG